MDVARLNFSHGTYAEHALSVTLVRAASARYQKPIAILADLPGPKIRTGTLEGGRPVMLRTGQRFTISTKMVSGNAEGVSVNYPRLAAEVRKGDRILLSDGLIELRVESSSGKRILCRVMSGGALGEHKGVNLPGVRLGVSAVTPLDRKHLAFALRQGVNYIGVSFVRRAQDILDAQAAVARNGKKGTPIIAKLEKPEAIDNLESILEVSDGVMVARGDLGVEMSPERVPVVQKMVIARAREALVPVITATQMLESMTEHPRPTRAEASDVANAIFDGSDAVMLSGETAAGRYPIEVSGHDGPHRPRSRIAHHTLCAAPSGRAHDRRRRGRRPDLPRLRTAQHESGSRIHRVGFDRAPDFQAPAAPADYRLLHEPGDPPQDFTVLGSAGAHLRSGE